MMYRDIVEIQTSPDAPHDVTDSINEIVQICQIKEGLCNIFLTATTAGLVINENDRMLFEDFRRFFHEHIPEERIYHHQENAFSHLRSSFLAQHLTLPVADGKLVLGEWQRIFLWEFDKEQRSREIVISVTD